MKVGQVNRYLHHHFIDREVEAKQWLAPKLDITDKGLMDLKPNSWSIETYSALVIVIKWNIWGVRIMCQWKVSMWSLKIFHFKSLTHSYNSILKILKTSHRLKYSPSINSSFSFVNSFLISSKISYSIRTELKSQKFCSRQFKRYQNWKRFNKPTFKFQVATLQMKCFYDLDQIIISPYFCIELVHRENPVNTSSKCRANSSPPHKSGNWSHTDCCHLFAETRGSQWQDRQGW